MTLSYWIRDYLYFPMGGNKAYARNIAIIFAVCGLWHGAGWTFIVWGLYHGFLVVGYHFVRRFWDALPNLLQIALTFVLVSFGWVLFIFDFQEITLFTNSLLGVTAAVQPEPTLEMWGFAALSGVVCFTMFAEKWIKKIHMEANASIHKNAGLAALLVFVLSRSFGNVHIFSVLKPCLS